MTTSTVIATIPTLTDKSAVVAAYAEADRKGKAAIRAALDAAIADAQSEIFALVGAGKLPEPAMLESHDSLRDIRESIVGQSAKTDKSVDYAQMVAEHLVALETAHSVVMAGGYELPEGVEIDLSDVLAKADEVRAMSATDIPENVTKLGIQFSTVKFGHSGPRRSNGAVAQHLTEWAETVEEGDFALISELAKFTSSVYDPANETNLDGRIAAHLFPAERAYGEGRYDLPELLEPVEEEAGVHGRGVRKL